MDEILLLLARKGAFSTPFTITTSELGTMLGMSQQNASHRLSLLEKSGLIERTKGGIILSKKGAEEIHSLYGDLKSAFEKNPASISGAIVSGSGEGKYYLSFPEYKNQIKEKFGFIPYEGTLNLSLSPIQLAIKSAFVKNSEPAIITGFKKQGRAFGDLFAYSCTVDEIPCTLLIPARTHHPPNIIEIAAPHSLKTLLGKKDGDLVSVKLGT